MSIEILNPVRIVKIGGQEVTVKELNWRESMEFLGRVSKYASQVFGPDGNASLDMAQLQGLILQTKELGEYLLTKTTGRDQAWLDELPLSGVVEIADAALELNFSEVLLKGKKVAGRVRAALGGTATVTSPLPSIS